MSPNPPEAGSSFDRTDALRRGKANRKSQATQPIDAIGCPSGVCSGSIPRLRDRAEPHSTPNSEGFREQALSGLERRALFVFVRRPRDCGAVKRARDFLHFLEQAAEIAPYRGCCSGSNGILERSAIRSVLASRNAFAASCGSGTTRSPGYRNSVA